MRSTLILLTLSQSGMNRGTAQTLPFILALILSSSVQVAQKTTFLRRANADLKVNTSKTDFSQSEALKL